MLRAVAAAALLPVLAACGGSAAAPAGITRKDPPSLVKLGDDLQRNGDAEGALTVYRAASASGGRNGTAFARVGQASNAISDPAHAEQAFRAAIQSGTTDGATQRGLATALLAQHRPAEAVPILAAIPDPDAQALRTYGVALDMVGRQADAQAAYRRGLALSPADANLHGDLALSLAISGQMDAALAEMHAATYAPVADPRQTANQVLLLAVAGQDAAARAQGITLLGPARTEVVMQQAGRVRAAPDAAARAAAFGILVGTSVGGTGAPAPLPY